MERTTDLAGLSIKRRITAQVETTGYSNTA